MVFAKHIIGRFVVEECKIIPGMRKSKNSVDAALPEGYHNRDFNKRIRKKQKANKECRMGNEAEDIELLMQQGVKEALALAKEAELDFDFTDKSIKEVENLLGEMYREYKKTGDEEGVHGLALMLAAYIGEVIRKKGFGGKWARNHPQMGKDSFPFHWRGHDLFLYGWCVKRILDGSGDNVFFKYQCLVLDELRKQA